MRFIDTSSSWRGRMIAWIYCLVWINNAGINKMFKLINLLSVTQIKQIYLLYRIMWKIELVNLFFFWMDLSFTIYQFFLWIFYGSGKVVVMPRTILPWRNRRCALSATGMREPEKEKDARGVTCFMEENEISLREVVKFDEYKRD